MLFSPSSCWSSCPGWESCWVSPVSHSHITLFCQYSFTSRLYRGVSVCGSILYIQKVLVILYSFLYSFCFTHSQVKLHHYLVFIFIQESRKEISQLRGMRGIQVRVVIIQMNIRTGTHPRHEVRQSTRTGATARKKKPHLSSVKTLPPQKHGLAIEISFLMRIARKILTDTE